MKINEENKILLLNFRNEFINIAKEKCKYQVTNKIISDKYKIVAISENGQTIENQLIKADYILCPNSFLNKEIECKNIISCGMSNRSTFGLSSVDSERSMFSVSKPFNIGEKLILPFEEPFKPDNRLSIYENIVLYGIEKISDSDICFKY